MRILTILCTTICENSYILYNEGCSDCVVIDPGSYEPVAEALSSNVLLPAAILLTHGHYDHIRGAKRLREETNAEIIIHAFDAGKLSDNEKNLSVYSVPKRLLQPFTADRIIFGGETFSYAGIEIETVFTPGHTEGGTSFLIRNEHALFSGDTLFRESFGRFDFYDGSLEKLRHSLIDSIFAIDGEYDVFPGHGDPTTLEHERKTNPILRFIDMKL